MENDVRNTARRIIAEQIEMSTSGGGEVQFAIYPYGANGIIVEQTLELFFGIKPAAIFDNNLCKYRSDIKPLNEMTNVIAFNENLKVLLTSSEPSIIEDVRDALYRYVSRDRVIELFSYSTCFDRRVNWLRNYSEMIREYYVEGSVAECGVFNGDFARYINLFFDDRKLHLFDTFTGFSERDVSKERNEIYSRFTSEEYIQSFKSIGVENVMDRMPHPQNVELHIGTVPETLDGVDDRFCFVNLDMDLYYPMYEAITFFVPRMNNGGVILLHDYFTNHLQGVKKALREYEITQKCKLQKIPTGDHLSIALLF